MSIHLKCLTSIVLVVVMLGASGMANDARAQADPQSYLFNTGQTIQPVFEGWAHNPDGSFKMHFGYLNRNYVDPIHVPIGEANRMSPGGDDQGQPTHFYARVNRRVFSVTVPADFGDRELIWQVTVGDETYRAVGWLQPEWEIATNRFRRFFGTPEEQAANQEPTLEVEAASRSAVSDTLTMTARVTDDGLPPPRDRSFRRPPTLPTFEEDPDGPTLPINVPQIQPENRSQPIGTRVDGVNVTWSLWRGSIGVSLAPQGEPENGVATVTARFSTPGEYVFRVQASDGPATTSQDVVVAVR